MGVGALSLMVTSGRCDGGTRSVVSGALSWREIQHPIGHRAASSVMCRDQHGGVVLACQRGERFPHRVSTVTIEVGSGLVGEDDPCVAVPHRHERTGDLHPAQLPARQFVGPSPDDRREPDVGQCSEYLLVRCGGRGSHLVDHR